MTSTNLYYVAALAIIALGTLLVLRRQARRQTKRMVADFPAKFPGRCMICSYHEYGVKYGFNPGPLAPHDCIEKKALDNEDEMVELSVTLEMHEHLHSKD